VKNYQTQYMAGLGGVHWWGKNANLYWKPQNAKMLELAKEHLRECAVVGLTERYDESLFLFKHVLGWPFNPAYFQLNKRSSKQDVPDELKQRIAEDNAFDVELYQLAQQLFEAKIKECGVDFHKELEQLSRVKKSLLLQWFFKIRRSIARLNGPENSDIYRS
jgi:hypothetical protein